MAFELPLGGDALVAQAEALELTELLRTYIFWCSLCDSHLRQRHFANLVQEPWVDAGEPRHLAHTHAAFKGIADVTEPLRLRRDQALRQPPRLQGDLRAGLLARFQSPPGLHQRFLEGAPNGHHLAHRLHLRAQRLVGAGKLFKLPLGNLDDNVIDSRLEAGRGLARDVVGNLVQRVAHGQLGGNLGDGKAGSLRGQRRGARNARIHLDHRHAAVDGIDGKLHIGAAGLDADLAHDGNGRVAHLLVLAVGERLRGGHGDGVAGMHAHGIEVLNGADDDDVVGEIAHHLQLVLLPAQHALFDQALVNGRKVQPTSQNLHQLFAVVGDAAAGAAQRETGTDEHRKAELRGKLQTVAQVVHQRRL